MYCIYIEYVVNANWIQINGSGVHFVIDSVFKLQFGFLIYTTSGKNNVIGRICKFSFIIIDEANT